MKAILISATVGVAFVFLLRFVSRWQATRWANRALDRVLHSDRYPTETRRKLDPESRFIVHLSEDEIRCDRPDGSVERVSWADLQRVEILTTADGPWLPDAFWVLVGASGGCVIPWGATGERELLPLLQQLSGFDSNAVINGASTTTEKRTLCWQRSLEGA